MTPRRNGGGGTEGGRRVGGGGQYIGEREQHSGPHRQHQLQEPVEERGRN